MAEKKIFRLLGWPIAILLTQDGLISPTHAQNMFQVCGSDYGNAVTNCATNPRCPTGDGCPAEQNVCYSLPESTCPDLFATASPTPMQTNATISSPPSGMPSAATMIVEDGVATTEELFVCGSDFEDAVANCETNVACPGFDMTLCPAQTACFSVPADQCPGPTAATGGEDAVPTPTQSPVIVVPTFSPTPEFIYVCGADYLDARDNCRDYPTCPTGDGCVDSTCFAIPYNMCPEKVPTSTPTVAVMPENTTAPSVAAVNVTTAQPTPAAAPTTAAPTGSPIYNQFFCGATYEEAEANCITTTPCPSGSGCPDGMACFGITAERCLSGSPTIAPTRPGPQPTDSPTSSPAPSASPSTPVPTKTQSGSPSKSPVINTHFCGTDYFGARDSCSSETACSDMVSCPVGETCFTGITCPTATPAETGSPGAGSSSAQPTVSNAGGVTTNPPVGSTIPVFDPNVTSYCGTNLDDTVENCRTSTPCPSDQDAECPVGQTCFTMVLCLGPPSPPSSSVAPTPSTASATNPPIGSTGQSMPPTFSSDASPLNNRFCGFTPDEAALNCATNTPCPDGSGAECTAGQACFQIDPECGAETPSSPTVAPTPVDITFGPPSLFVPESAAPSSSPTQTPKFDPDITSFCGKIWDDTVANCFTSRQCASGDSADCADGETCFPDIKCEAPPSLPPTPAPTVVGANETAFTPTTTTTAPVGDKTIKPTFNWASIPNGSICSWDSVMANAVLVSSCILGAIVVMV